MNIEIQKVNSVDLRSRRTTTERSKIQRWKTVLTVWSDAGPVDIVLFSSAPIALFSPTPLVLFSSAPIEVKNEKS
jgi:hypothetical protein